jgi:hypothetical protein
MPYDLELEQAVEKLQKSDAPLSKADQYAQLKKFSNRARLPTESPEQAFAKFITTDPHGKQLYRTFTQNQGRVVLAPNGGSGGLEATKRKIRQRRRRRRQQ